MANLLLKLAGNNTTRSTVLPFIVGVIIGSFIAYFSYGYSYLILNKYSGEYKCQNIPISPYLANRIIRSRMDNITSDYNRNKTTISKENTELNHHRGTALKY